MPHLASLALPQYVVPMKAGPSNFWRTQPSESTPELQRAHPSVERILPHLEERSAGAATRP
ncbi:hypothetical protein SBV1_430008 [Verrucomicrobia bacterium]|nr:hypothetical protein SBV1_430008 [Verrucomicrobiota bacterium]